MEEDFTIKVQIAQRHYPIKIRREDEERVRKAAKLINDRIKEYESQYAVKDKSDLLAMCALQITTELLQQGDDEKGTFEDLRNDISYLDSKISSLLS
jgi:cell division protein ZapA